MTVVSRIARSRTVAALASPHGVDHYLSRINPMWAAHEVRAQVVDVRRETDTPGAPVATLNLQPTATWRGHRAGQYVQVGLDVPGSARRMTASTLGTLTKVSAAGAGAGGAWPNRRALSPA